ncbi:MAG TPA: hypothetical protein VHX61_12205 [Rhizomicrobium sp.]|jgi:hypothetical protein|nr:hypothetical protein [Rhizomicrobium sp.]
MSSDTRLSVRGPQPREMGQGLACSLLLHGLFALLIFWLILRPGQPPQQSPVRFLPIDLVQLAQQTTSPPQPLRAPIPRAAPSRPAREVPSSPHAPVTLAPSRKLPPPDTLEIRLRQLAKLRQPDSTLPHLDNGASDEAATSDTAAPGAMAAYRVRDFLQAQVERRWNLDLKRARNVVILIHVVVARDGTIDHADIVDRARYASDAAWRAVALSARDAVLLSSPLNLPSGYKAGPIDVTLALNPKDVLR